MKDKYFDLAGMYIATLCLIHCLLAPLLFLIPLQVSHTPVVDLVFFGLGLYPVYKVLKSKASLYLKILLVSSLLLVRVSILLEYFEIHSFLIYIGATGLIAGHVINFKSHRY